MKIENSFGHHEQESKSEAVGEIGLGRDQEILCSELSELLERCEEIEARISHTLAACRAPESAEGTRYSMHLS